jgi:hypothetical protein
MQSRFSVPLASLADKLKLDLQTVSRKAAADLFTAVVVRSPVDTGRFKSNWNFSLDAPDSSTSGSDNQARGLTEAGKAATMRIGGVAYLSNGLPYAKRLEYGYSKQAAAGMVRVSAAEFSDNVRRALAK